MYGAMLPVPKTTTALGPASVHASASDAITMRSGSPAVNVRSLLNARPSTTTRPSARAVCESFMDCDRRGVACILHAASPVSG